MPAGRAMTKGEREDLLKLVRNRERVLKHAAEQRSAEMLAQFEQQVSAIHEFDKDEVWEAVYNEAAQAAQKAQDAVEDRAKALGIPEEFRPRIALNWVSRGRNAWAQRRGELRILAKAEITALEHKAKVEIERMSVDAQTAIIAHGLESDAAKAFLEAMPAVEKLMPAPDLKAIEDRADAINRKDQQRYN